MNERLKDIWISEKLDKELFLSAERVSRYDEAGIMRAIENILICQYANPDVDDILEHHGTNEITDFINRLELSKVEYKDRKDDRYLNCGLTADEIVRFRMLNESVNRISRDNLAENSNTLTTRSFLEMCRVAYDAASEWKYPEDISDSYLYPVYYRGNKVY